MTNEDVRKIASLVNSMTIANACTYCGAVGQRCVRYTELGTICFASRQKIIVHKVSVVNFDWAGGTKMWVRNDVEADE
jgi:hypothetical protein